MNKRTLKKIKQFLPVGEQKRIAKELGYSHSYVNKVLNGRRKNLKIIAEAVKTSKTYETEITGRASR
ncbi:MAG: hypothetical protein PHS05_13160 [Bacteroidales bacterium]|nr:hypothetical protein [Bacteroidales bacterium]